jgi:two-component system, cell cycle sensor histidine kinase and response regulator CckA
VPHDDQGSWVVDDRGYTVSITDQLAETFGSSASEMVGRPVSEFVRPRKTTDEALRLSEQRLKTIIDTEPACVKLMSADGRLLDMNRAGLRMLGATDLSQVQGHYVVNLVHPSDREKFIAAHRAASQGHPSTVECRVIALTGSELWLEMHAVPFDAAAIERGECSAVLSVTHDLTQRKLLEDELHQSQKLEAVGRLAGGVAHDFNNLLTAILGYCDFAGSHLGPGHAARAELAQIRAAGERAVALTAQLLAFSRKQILNPRVIDVNNTVRGLLNMLPRILGEHITTSASLDPQVLRVTADPTQLEQVLLNLALNARDAMPGGGSLSIETSNVTLTEPPVSDVRDFEPGPYVRFVVADTGLGMDSETEAHLFEPFFTTKEVGHGTGLGLSTVYGIVKQSHGFIAVHTELGVGTTFTIDLPATTAEPDEMPVVMNFNAKGGRETVLLVEDAEPVRELQRRVLEAAGYEVLVAADPVAALDIAEQAEGRIDLLVTDVIMPILTGPQLAAEITRRWPFTRTLYVSGYSEKVVRGTNGREDPPLLLKKPFMPNQLVEAVREALDQPRKVEKP